DRVPLLVGRAPNPVVAPSSPVTDPRLLADNGFVALGRARGEGGSPFHDARVLSTRPGHSIGQRLPAVVTMRSQRAQVAAAAAPFSERSYRAICGQIKAASSTLSAGASHPTSRDKLRWFSQTRPRGGV